MDELCLIVLGRMAGDYKSVGIPTICSARLLPERRSANSEHLFKIPSIWDVPFCGSLVRQGRRKASQHSQSIMEALLGRYSRVDLDLPSWKNAKNNLLLTD